MPTQHFRRRGGGVWDDELLGVEFRVIREVERSLHVEVIDATELAEEHPMEREVFVLHHGRGDKTIVHAQSFVDELLQALGRHRSERGLSRNQMRRDVERAGGTVDEEPAVEVAEKGGTYSITREPKLGRWQRFLIHFGFRDEPVPVKGPGKGGAN